MAHLTGSSNSIPPEGSPLAISLSLSGKKSGWQTLEIYARSMSEDRLLAQGMFIELLFSHKKSELLDGVVVEQLAATAGNMKNGK